MVTKVTVALIGDFGLVVDGRSVTRDDFERGSAVELVQLLAMRERHRLDRDQIVDALWPDVPLQSASNHLNKAASYARTALGDKTAIVVKEGTVALFPAATIRVDFHEVLGVDTTDEEAVNHVLDKHGGELLPDSLYAEWTVEPRRQLHLFKLDLLRQATRWFDVLKLDATDEEAHLALMAQAIERGDRDDVLRRFDQLEAMLRDEFGVEPSGAALELRDRAAEAGSRRTERALEMLQSAPHNLPVQLSSFVGREDEILEVSELVRQSRLVTLTGVGGVGKTRLSLQVATGLLGEFDDGVWLVELAPLLEPGMIADTVAAAMSIPIDPATPSRERVLSYMANRQVLLVIDNCEHLIDEVSAFVDELLSSCHRVHALATSRIGLALTGEALWRVPSLDAAPGGAALDLFVERTRLVQPGFAISDANRETVTGLCRRLDGIPLAIELATARLKMLSVGQLMERLDDRFQLLTGGSRTAVARQRTLQAMMDWSYDLLSPAEQALLRRLAVFADGFTCEAAEEVCAGEALSPFDVLDRLGNLVEASLVTFVDGDSPRYRLLETVRQFGLDRLIETVEVDDARLRHCEHYAATAQALIRSLDVREPDAVRSCEDELGNYRAAMVWAIEAGHGDLVLSIAVALRHIFWPQSMDRESLRWLTAGLELRGGDQTQLVHKAVAFALVDANNTTQAKRVLELAPLARRLLLETDDDTSRGFLSNALGVVRLFDDLLEGDRLLVDAARMLRSAGDPMWRAAVTNRMLSGWWMNSSKIFSEVLDGADLAVEQGLGLVSEPILRVATAVVEQDFDRILSSSTGLETSSVWEESVLIYSKTYAYRATGRLDEALAMKHGVEHVGGATIEQFLMRLQFALGHLERGEVEEAIVEFVPFRTDTRLGMAISSWFESLIAERQLRYADSALLAGFSNRIGNEASYAPHSFDQTLLNQSQAALRNHLGDTRTEQLYAQGAASDWDNLSPLTRAARHTAEAVPGRRSADQ